MTLTLTLFLISGGETFMIIPQELQKWDFYALRDEYVQDELLRASHIEPEILGENVFYPWLLRLAKIVQ